MFRMLPSGCLDVGASDAWMLEQVISVTSWTELAGH